ncbi:MAG: hypothetical protein J7M14_06290 [Planctomycetes bacterium]|nr:hypothetical protein [Planctomycetota bacterium]
MMKMSDESDRVLLSGGGLTCVFDRANGRVVELVNNEFDEEFVSAETLSGGLEVYDELDRRLYSDLDTPSAAIGFRVEAGTVHFTKQFDEAPFSLECSWRADEAGLHLEANALLAEGAPMRSIRISVALPAIENLISWAPSYPPASDVRKNPVRYCYLADEPGRARTGIPMLTLYRAGGGGLSMVMPLEIPKVQLNMGVEPADPRPWYVPEKVSRIRAEVEVDAVTPLEAWEPGETPVIRFTEKQVGLRPGKSLKFGMWFFAHAGDWRPSLGRVVERYSDYFEPSDAAMALAGGRSRAFPDTITQEAVRPMAGLGITHAWFHGHFAHHGEPLTDEAVSDSNWQWTCEPFPKRRHDISVDLIRSQIDILKSVGTRTFLYGFNMHCEEAIIEKRGLEADVCRNEDGQVARSYHDQAVMFFSPESPFGAHQLDQMDRMMAAYPEIIGVALDNWNYCGIDFAHDDGVTMVNNRPAANVNFSQQRMVRAIAEKMHATGRMLMSNKGRTIESLRGVDFMGTEAPGAETFATFAYMNVARNVTPTEYKARDDAEYAEYVMKYALVWGGQLNFTDLYYADPEQFTAYQGLALLLRNRRWVFEPYPLELPQDTQGQIFRIHRDSPDNAGAVVVTVVRPEASWKDPCADIGELTVRLAGADRFTRAEWLGVDRATGGPPAEHPRVECDIIRDGSAMRIALPPMSSAGVLKLS